jgi:DNA-binding Xre family transcriptional regulator
VELARQTGLNINTVCKLANNAHTMLHLGVLEAVCKVLGVQPGDVLHYISGNEAST